MIMRELASVKASTLLIHILKLLQKVLSVCEIMLKIGVKLLPSVRLFQIILDAH